MFANAYTIIWFLLPLALLLLTLRAYFRKLFKAQGREYAQDYFWEFVFCLVMFFIAVWLDRTLVESFFNDAAYAEDYRFLRWLTYPAVMLFVAILQEKKKKKK